MQLANDIADRSHIDLFGPCRLFQRRRHHIGLKGQKRLVERRQLEQLAHIIALGHQHEPRPAAVLHHPELTEAKALHKLGIPGKPWIQFKGAQAILPAFSVL
ncbi:hypothetical protein D3C73_821820 [compost metagenome]